MTITGTDLCVDSARVTTRDKAAGIVTDNCTGEIYFTEANCPSISTLGGSPLKFVPLMVITLPPPNGPLLGFRDCTLGASRRTICSAIAST